jgi:hypothetical protein
MGYVITLQINLNSDINVSSPQMLWQYCYDSVHPDSGNGMLSTTHAADFLRWNDSAVTVSLLETVFRVNIMNFSYLVIKMG